MENAVFQFEKQMKDRLRTLQENILNHVLKLESTLEAYLKYHEIRKQKATHYLVKNENELKENLNLFLPDEIPIFRDCAKKIKTEMEGIISCSSRASRVMHERIKEMWKYLENNLENTTFEDIRNNQLMPLPNLRGEQLLIEYDLTSIEGTDEIENHADQACEKPEECPYADALADANCIIS